MIETSGGNALRKAAQKKPHGIGAVALAQRTARTFRARRCNARDQCYTASDRRALGALNSPRYGPFKAPPPGSADAAHSQEEHEAVDRTSARGAARVSSARTRVIR